jgi:glyoxylase-like metal-dependent hydrolase (beta-lactamase superfamily II)
MSRTATMQRHECRCGTLKRAPHRVRQMTVARLVLALVVSGASFAQTNDIKILPVRGNIYMLSGAGANITVSAGPDGILLVDTGTAQMTVKVLAALNDLARTINTSGLPNKNVPPTKPIRYIINTGIRADHSGGNEKLAAAGQTFTGGNVSGNLQDAAEGAAIVAHENALNRLTEQKLTFKALPTETFFTDSKKLSHFFNGEGVQIIHEPNAQSDGDSLVWFRGSDVISAGDIFLTTTYPVIDMARGGNVQGVLNGLNRIIDLAIPEFRSEGGTMVIPGHGRISDIADVAYYRDMVTIVRDRVQDMIKRNMTLAQIKDSRPTLDYDGRYGSPDAFLESVYRSLTQSSSTAGAKK